LLELSIIAFAYLGGLPAITRLGNDLSRNDSAKPPKMFYSRGAKAIGKMAEGRASNRISQITASMSGRVIDAAALGTTAVVFSKKLNRAERSGQRGNGSRRFARP